MSRDEDFDPFLDEVKGVKSSSKKDLKKRKKDEALYGPASFDFGDQLDDDDAYGSKKFSGGDDSNQEKVTIQSLFEFRPWEIFVLVMEILLVTYLVLVVLKVIPLF